MKLSFLSTAVAALVCTASTATAELTPFNITYDVFSIGARMSLAAVAEVAFERGDAWLNSRTTEYLLDAHHQLEHEVLTVAAYTQITDAYYQSAVDYDYKKFATLADLVATREGDISQRSSITYAPQSSIDVIFDVLASVVGDNGDAAARVELERAFAEAAVTEGKSLALIAAATQSWLDTFETMYPDLFEEYGAALSNVFADAQAEYYDIDDSA